MKYLVKFPALDDFQIMVNASDLPAAIDKAKNYIVTLMVNLDAKDIETELIHERP